MFLLFYGVKFLWSSREFCVFMSFLVLSGVPFWQFFFVCVFVVWYLVPVSRIEMVLP